MGSGPWSLLTRYGLAAVLTALAILASLLLAPHWNPRHLLLPFYPAVNRADGEGDSRTAGE